MPQILRCVLTSSDPTQLSAEGSCPCSHPWPCMMRAEQGSETQEPHSTEIPAGPREPLWPPHFTRACWTQTNNKTLKGCHCEVLLLGKAPRLLLFPMTFGDIGRCKKQMAFSAQELANEKSQARTVQAFSGRGAAKLSTKLTFFLHARRVSRNPGVWDMESSRQ